MNIAKEFWVLEKQVFAWRSKIIKEKQKREFELQKQQWKIEREIRLDNKQLCSVEIIEKENEETQI